MAEPYLQKFGRGAGGGQSAIDRATRGGVRSADLASLNSGQSVTATLAAATPLSISHTLGRTPTGWFVTDIDAAATVHRTAWDPRSITLEASAAATITVWVF